MGVQALRQVFVFALLIYSTTTGQTVHGCPTSCRCNYDITMSCDAGLHRIPNGISEHIKSLHLAGNTTRHNTFNQLGQADIPNLPDLRHLNLGFSGINTIGDNTFRNLKELRQLKLNHNTIKEISKNTFIGLSKLEVLDLSGNPNIRIQEGAFQNSPLLQEIYLGEAGIKTINTDIFAGISDIKILDLHGNAIETLSAGFVSSFPLLKVLDISLNSLRSLHKEDWTAISKLPTFHINGNPWRCNCEVKFLKSTQLFNNFAQYIDCSEPIKLQYMTLSKVSESDLKCTSPQIISCSNISKELKEKDSLKINCNISGNPLPEVEWITPKGIVIHSKNVSSSGRYKVFGNGTLEVPSVSLLDDGLWTISVNNVEGMVKRSFTINVNKATSTTITTKSSPPSRITTSTALGKTTASKPDTHRLKLTSTLLSKKYQWETQGVVITSMKNIASIPATLASKEDKVMKEQRSTGSDSDTTIGIIVASIGGGCTVIVIITLLIVLSKYIKNKNRVRDSVDDKVNTKDVFI